jgi:hypothetical protein
MIRKAFFWDFFIRRLITLLCADRIECAKNIRDFFADLLILAVPVFRHLNLTARQKKLLLQFAYAVNKALISSHKRANPLFYNTEFFIEILQYKLPLARPEQIQGPKSSIFDNTRKR